VRCTGVLRDHSGLRQDVAQPVLQILDVAVGGLDPARRPIHVGPSAESTVTIEFAVGRDEQEHGDQADERSDQTVVTEGVHAYGRLP
jgi:hypothetical protein